MHQSNKDLFKTPEEMIHVASVQWHEHQIKRCRRMILKLLKLKVKLCLHSQTHNNKHAELTK